MRDNVVLFPAEQVREWAFVERAMNEAFAAGNASEAAQTRVAEQMKPYWAILDNPIVYSLPVVLPGELNTAQSAALLKAIERYVSETTQFHLRAFTTRLFLERFWREVALCQELGIW